MERHAKIQPLFLQMSLLKVETAYARSIRSMQTAILWYAQPLNTCNRICTSYKYFLRLPFSATPIRVLTVNKRFRTNSINCKIFIYIHINLYVPQGEVGGKSPLKLPSRTHLAKIEDKKVLKNLQLEFSTGLSGIIAFMI